MELGPDREGRKRGWPLEFRFVTGGGDDGTVVRWGTQESE